ncbi:putative VQ motif-containing protein 4-like [Iris pallida]|uniref:VQ motif-containing protein 4-like n=1 Tax=Iris pallida TaxID=29817 RepID=A0AAX6IJ86_IRIPA|nr:putative VQ motif-containing protein 4-like [Iris pallida]
MDKSPHPYPSSSPNSSSCNGVAAAASLPPTPKSPIPNPYPTTFVQADAQSFKQVVQMLTGSAETAAKRAAAHNPAKNHTIPPLNRAKKPAFKLYERRPSMKNLKMIGTLVPSLAGRSPPSSARSPLSPSVLDFPSLALSPVTPLDMAAATTPEERAIAEKGYYLHPSPRPATTPGGSEPPRLLPLFPLTSPRD